MRNGACVAVLLLWLSAPLGAHGEARPQSTQELTQEPIPEPARDPEIDQATGLKKSANWELARAHCGVCHSHRLVTANRGNREYWLDMLRWMQRTQNLWPIPPQQEAQLLDYLADNYNETEWGRRPPLSPSLMPTARAPAPSAAP